MGRKPKVSEQRLIELARDTTTAGLRRLKLAMPSGRRGRAATIGLDDYSLEDARRDYRGSRAPESFDDRLAARLLRVELFAQAMEATSKRAPAPERGRVARISRLIGREGF